MKSLQNILNECKSELDNLKITYGKTIYISKNSRFKKWGQCSRRPDGTYWIEISERLLNENAPFNGVKDTVMHELLHTCPGCMNHGAKWKSYANTVNKMYGYNIKRCNSSNEKGIDITSAMSHAKYAFKCQKCGAVILRYKKSKFTMHPEWYRCSVCKGNFTRLK